MLTAAGVLAVLDEAPGRAAEYSRRRIWGDAEMEVAFAA
jgi:hypothetical protein